MKNTLLTLLLLLICWCNLHAQSAYVVKGTVGDSSSAVKITDASISILQAKDSILVKFVWSGPDGTFAINDLAKGNFILLVSYPEYADYSEQFTLDSNTTSRDFGKLQLATKTRLLTEVLIKARAAIVIRGDTTEFNADKFVIQPNSKVEDLIKQFPGIEVDNNGKITAQGKTVPKVLVDGDEFFGDDPTLVTHNIRGDMVDKIQLYDDKTAEAKRSGIDDGKTIKTMNVILKAEKKNGYFGKADAGAATDHLYQTQALFNSFRTNNKLSIFGFAGNTGKVGVGFADGDKYGASSYISGGSWRGTLDELETFSGKYEGRGIPKAGSGGVHFDSRWNNGKNSFITNYKIGSLDVNGIVNTQNEDFLSSARIFSNADQTTVNSLLRQKLDIAYQAPLTPDVSLDLYAEGITRNSNTNTSENGSRQRGDHTFLNRSGRNLSNDLEQKMMSLSAYLNKKFKKAGRSMTLSIVQSYNGDNRKGYLNSTNQYYNTTGALDSTQRVDQYRLGTSETYSVSTAVSVTEPISKTTSFGMNYRFGYNNSTNDRRSFNRSIPGIYNIQDNSYTNELEYHLLTNQIGGNIYYRKSKNNLTLGTTAVISRYNQNDAFAGTEFKRNYINWSPSVMYNYRISQQKSFSLSYSGSSGQPPVSQIQSLRINDDPLNIIIGNPLLRPSFSNGMYAYYNSFKVLTNLSFYISGQFAFTSNPIVTSSITDAAGKRIIQWVNNRDQANRSNQINSSLGKKLKNEIQAQLSASTYNRTEFNFINNVMNKTVRSSYSTGASISKSQVKKYTFSIKANPVYEIYTQSLQKELNDNRWSVYSSASFTFYLPGKTEISSDARYVFTQKTGSFGQPINPLIWNSSFSKKFLKSENLMLSFTMNDLLKQNKGFSRGAFSQTSYLTIQRYFLASLSWDFSKMGNAPNTQE